MTSVQNIVRTAVPAAALALLLTGCGPDNPNGPAGPTATGTGAATASTGGSGDGGLVGGTSTATPAPAPTSADTGGGSGGGSGTGGASGGSGGGGSTGGGGGGTFANPLGPTATGNYVGKTKADLAPVSFVRANVADLGPLNIPASELAGKTPYLLTMSYTNRSGGVVADNYFMQLVRVTTGEHDTGVMAGAVAPGRSIPACNVGERAPSLADGQTQKSCSIYLVPTGTTPAFIKFGSIMDDHPLVWKTS